MTRVTVFGRASYTIAPGKALKVKVKLSKAARRLLTRKRKLKVTLVLRDGTGRLIRQRTVTLRATTKR